MMTFLLLIFAAVGAAVMTRLWYPPFKDANGNEGKAAKDRWFSYVGIVLGAGYGILIRILFENNSAFADFFSFDLLSITFLWIVPVVIALFPLWFASDAQLQHRWYPLWAPMLSIFLFFACALISRLEDVLCLVIIGAPFLFGAMVAGAIAAPIILRYRRRKGDMLVLALLPVLMMMVEGSQEPVKLERQIQTGTIIRAPVSQVWNRIIRVARIAHSEYDKGPFQWAGVPRPVMAELNSESLGGKRVGHFDSGLRFDEEVTIWEPGKRMALSIKVVPASLGNRIFERHLLQGDHFRFLAAVYELHPLDSETTELRLTCEYELRSNVNGYASMWGKCMIEDFQERLLAVIRNRCEEPAHR